MGKPNDIPSQRLEPLFDMELQYKQDMPVVTSSKSIVGKLLGSGIGTVKGPKIQGTVRWDLFEEQSDAVCKSNLRGVIETNDGATVHFDTMGFFMRPDKSNSRKWITTAAVSFNTTEKSYEWLNTALAVWEGEFDMGTYRHRYRAYTRVGG
jgi:hypothetical protein